MSSLHSKQQLNFKYLTICSTKFSFIYNLLKSFTKESALVMRDQHLIGKLNDFSLTAYQFHYIFHISNQFGEDTAVVLRVITTF